MALAREGASGMTLVDVSRDAAEETARLATAEGDASGNGALIKCVVVRADVRDADALRRAFETHVTTFGTLHVCFNNAGVEERRDWRSVVDINLNAVIHGTNLAVQAMTSGTDAASPASPAAVVNVASAGGIFPMPQAPVYSATKAAVVLYSRSLAHLATSKGVRVNALCPQFTDTSLVSRQFTKVGDEQAKALLAQTGGSLLTVSQVVDAALALVKDDTRAGEALAVMNAKGGVATYVPVPNPKHWKPVPGLARGRMESGLVGEKKTSPQSFPPPSPPPASFRRVVVHTLSADFAAATKIVSAPVPTPGAGEVLVERRWTGVNASDVNFTSGRYFGGVRAATKQLPFDAGFESVGIVAATGAGDTGGLVPGQPVATTTYGGFSEYATAPWKMCMPVPEASPQVLALLTSGLTASLALEQAGGLALPAVEPGGGDASSEGGLRRRKTVLVTAAAGGTGQIAVQLAKLAGHHVVATCGGDAKATMLARLGADRVINYHKEKVRDVLRKEYKGGIDLAYESVGGEMFAATVDALAQGGKIIVIGMMSQYKAGGDGAADAWTPSEHKGLPEKLLWKSGACVGFFLPHYAKHFRRHLSQLYALHKAGRLAVEIDPTSFIGLEAVPRAVEHLQSGKSMGKVAVMISEGSGARSKL